MTITNDERREVARRLRETGEELGSAALLWYHIAKALGVRTATDGKTACDMLADLIEPEPERTCYPVFEDEILVCSECSEDIDGYGWNYCPNCGAKVVDE